MSVWKELRSEFVVPIYDEHVVVVVTTDVDASICKINPEYDGPQFAACVLWPHVAGEYFVLVHVRDVEDLSVVGHELFHLTVRMAHRNGFRFDVDNHEAYAFLQGFLSKEVCTRLRDLANQLPES
jgi:hypothetical protein